MADLTLPYTPSTVDPTQVLLPENRTKLETDLVKVQARTTDVLVPYRDLFNPWKCPEDFLPWLASNWTVDLWYEDWPVTTKRKIIANMVSLKRGKGKLSGIEGYLSYVNGIVVKAVVPPAKGFYQGALTPQQRLDFVNSLPYIQIQDYQATRVPPQYRAFMSADSNVHRKKYFYGNPFGQSSAGPLLYGRKAFFSDPLHPEIPPSQVNYRSFIDPGNGEQIEQVFIQFDKQKRSFYGRSFARLDADTGTYRDYARNTRAALNMLSVSLNSGASQQYASFSGDYTYNVNPQTIFQQRVSKSRAFFGKSFYGSVGIRNGFLRISVAPSLIYDRISIYDASRVPPESKVRTFYGRSRFGIAAFHAELTISFPMYRGLYRRNEFYGSSRSFMKSWNPEPLYRALDAIRVAKSARDKVLIQPQTHEYVRLGSSLHLGSFKLGDLVSTLN